MDESPTADLITLKKICIALERVMAHTSSMNLEEVARLADEARYLADCIGTWAREKRIAQIKNFMLNDWYEFNKTCQTMKRQKND